MRLPAVLLVPAALFAGLAFAAPSAVAAQEGEDCGEIYCSGCNGQTYGHCFVEGSDDNKAYGLDTEEEQELFAALLVASQVARTSGVVSFAGRGESGPMLSPEWANALVLSSRGDGPYHGECRVCQYASTPISPVNCHPLCEPGEEDSEFATVEYQDLIDAASEGTLRAVVEASLKVPSAVQINDSRRSLQILSCQGTIIANLPLADLYVEMTERLDRALAEADE